MGAAGRYPVVCAADRRHCYSSPEALSDQIKRAPASLLLSPLTLNKYLGCSPLLFSHIVKQTLAVHEF